MKRIILLEDDAHLARQLTATLESEGYSVASFGATADALEQLETEGGDLIISDILIHKDEKLQRTGGITLISQARQTMGLDIPIIAISGAFNSEIADAARSTSKTVGATAVLAKPFHPDDLLDLVAEVLSRHA